MYNKFKVAKYIPAHHMYLRGSMKTFQVQINVFFADNL